MRFGLSARLALLVHFIRYKLRVYKAVFFTSLSRYKVWMVDIRLHGLPWRPDYCGHFLAATSLGGHLPWRLLGATSCSDHNLAANLVIFCSVASPYLQDLPSCPLFCSSSERLPSGTLVLALFSFSLLIWKASNVTSLNWANCFSMILSNTLEICSLITLTGNLGQVLF